MMITVDALLVAIERLDRADLERWIANDWVRPEGGPGHYLFRDIDVARVRLIVELREALEINEPALPAVLQLIDQLYALRRRMRAFNAALDDVLPAETRTRLAERLRDAGS